jgi:hypothetical protein
MALILAIEPDRKQAAQLASLIKARVGAELVLAETTEQALGMIGNRVPDLVLVPALLAPQDDATLAAALRVIAAAAHVQMLTIPLLAPARGATEPLGMLARLRRRRTDPVPPDGCDPDVFGGQIAAYLAEAAAERAINASDREIELSTFTLKRSTDTKELSQADLSVQVVPGGERSIEPTDAEPTIAGAGDAFTLAEAVVERATIEPVPDMLDAFTTKDTKDTKEISLDGPDLRVLREHATIEEVELAETLQTEVVEQLTAAESSIAAADGFTLTTTDIKDTKEFFLDSADLGVLAERTMVEPLLEALEASTTKDTKDTKEISLDSPDLSVLAERTMVEPLLEALEAFTTKDTKDAKEPSLDSPDLCVPGVLGGEVPIDGSKRIAVSEAPWSGPQRRWPGLEGQEAVDHLTVSAAEETVNADVHTEFLPAAVLPSIDELPAIRAAVDESATVVVEPMPIDVQEALPAMVVLPLEEPAPSAVLELWMPLSFGATPWPTLEGAWSEARPDPPAPMLVDPPALVHAAPPPPVHADPPAPAHVDAPAPVLAAPPAGAAAAAPPPPAADQVAPPDAIAARPEWIELIESLRQDVKRLRSERTQAPVAGPRTKEMPAPVARPAATLRRAAVADVDLTPKQRAKPAKPAQDEWGFFDPEQCGFAALLAKLDEITHVPDGA